MCLVPTVEDRNGGIPLVFLVHCLSGSLPLAAAVSAPGGSLGSGSAPCSWALWCCLSQCECLLGPPVLALPLILSFQGPFPWHLLFGIQQSCLWVQQVFFLVFVFLQASCWEQTFLHCQGQHNLQHFLPACWAQFAHHGLVFASSRHKNLPFPWGNVHELCSWGSLSPLILGLRHFLILGWMCQQVWSLGWFSVLPIFLWLPFQKPVSFTVLWTSLISLQSLPLSLIVTVGVVFLPLSTISVLELLFERTSTAEV